MYRKEAPDPTLKKLQASNWDNYIVGTFLKDSNTLEESQQNTLERIERLFPKIKKSNKILVLSDGNSFVPIYLSSKYQCKITILCETKEALDMMESDVEKYEQQDYISCLQRDFDQTQLDYDYYDMVYSMNSISSHKEVDRVLAEVRRTLVPQGRFILLEKSYNGDVSSDFDFYETDDFLRKALRADLEKVYFKEFSKETQDHYVAVRKKLDKEKKSVIKVDGEKGYKSAIEAVDKLIELSAENKVSWKFIQLQKRNA
jgi:sarcosine/dimethylglycine N-methyltransferase